MESSANAASPPPVHRRKKFRSPSYPAIGLAAAIDRASDLYEVEGRSPTPVGVAVQHWGYAIKSSGGLQTVAALKKFGLLGDEGSGEARKVSLTDLALDIILDEREGSSERRAAIQQAALSPPIHRQLWDRHGAALPSDRNLRYELTRELHFGEAAADELIREFRQTLDFAGLGKGDVADTLSDSPPDKSENPPVNQPPAAPPRQQAPAGEIAIPVLLKAGQAQVKLQGTFPVTEAEWDRMLALLEAHRPGLVETDD